MYAPSPPAVAASGCKESREVTMMRMMSEDSGWNVTDDDDG